MTKREMMERKVQAILQEVAQMREVITRMEKELHGSGLHSHLDTKELMERCTELHARLEDIRAIVEESRQMVERTEEVEEPDLWL